MPVRLPPGVDLRRALEDLAKDDIPSGSAFVVAGIGSLVEARIRHAGQADEVRIGGPLEILTLAGSLSRSGAHLHISVSDAAGFVRGGHAGYGNIVRTTAEILLAPLAEWELSRGHDPATGYAELAIRRLSEGR